MNTPAQAEKFKCVGFSFIISIQECTPKDKPVVSDFCKKMESRVGKLKFRKEQVSVFDRSQKEAIAQIILDYKKSCR